MFIYRGVVGYLGGRFAPSKFAIGGAYCKAGKSAGAALIDDTTPTPEHARFTWSRGTRVLGVFLGLWAAGIGGLMLAFGWDAVDHFQWLTAPQMMHGLALGETTPGPLIMVVSFVGFVGGWTKALFGSDLLLLSGAVAATVVTFFTFLPSFFFILLGGPFIESTHGNLKFTAPLTGITAAVVGVIVNLAVFFAYHVLWPTGLSGRFDALSAAIGIVAAFALIRFKVGVIPVVLISGLAGLGLRFL